MNQIEKTIFDSLARKKGINLPGLGSLSVVQVPAEFITDSSLRPPHNKIIFSSSLNPDLRSVGELKGYEQWLERTVRGNGIREINGVGILRGNIFYPSVELHEILNPHGTQPVTLKPRYGWKRKLLVALAVVAAAVLVVSGAVLIGRFAAEKAVTAERVSGTTSLAEIEEAGASARGESTIEAAVAGEVAREAAHPASASRKAEETNSISDDQRKGEADSAPVSRSTAAASENDKTENGIRQGLEEYASAAPGPARGTRPTYHLVAGVFSEPANADKLIVSDPLGIGSSAYGKVDFGKGRILVSAFSSPDRERVESRRRELARVNSDLWIYQEEAKPVQ